MCTESICLRGSELIAHDRTVEEIQAAIGADWLIYQDLPDLVTAARDGNPDINDYEDSVFSGNYVTGDVTADYLVEFKTDPNDTTKTDRDAVHFEER